MIYLHMDSSSSTEHSRENSGLGWMGLTATGSVTRSSDLRMMLCFVGLAASLECYDHRLASALRDALLGIP